MKAAFGSLLRDGWVIGIACAAALAYTLLQVVEDTLVLLFSFVDGVPASAYEGARVEDLIPFSAVVNGRVIYFEPILRHTILFALTVVICSLALHATRSPEDDVRADAKSQPPGSI